MSDRAVYRFLDTNGDGTGNKNAAVDGSSTPVEFKFNGFGVVELSRMIIFVRDNGILTAEGYGALMGQLTNGIDVELWKGGSMHMDLLDGVPVKSNVDWARACYDVETSNFGAGDNYVRARWTFVTRDRALRVGSSDQLIVRINDNMSGLVEHYFSLQGAQLL